MDKITMLQKIIDNSKRIVFFTGAGVSTESNIPDFRSSRGVFTQVNSENPEELVSRGYFQENPKKFYKFYRDNLIYPNAEPNAAHYAIANLEAKGLVTAVITQNIDNLHQKAGSKNVIELHGSVYRNFCGKCGKKYGLETILETKEVPHCDCGGIIEPDVVLYGDPLSKGNAERAIEVITNADTLIIVGTSLSVFPAASFVRYFSGDNLIVINRGKTSMDSAADLVIHNYAGEVLNQLTI